MWHHYDRRQGNHAGHGRGPSSFWMHDSEKVFGKLNLKPGEVFLDLGCGPGDYSLRAAEEVGEQGLVYALDRQDEAIRRINEKISNQGCSNIQVIKADITQPLPIADASVDVCFLSTVLHIFKINKAELTLFGEILRVLRPGGRLAVIECKKEEQPFGPPKHMRLSPEEVTKALGKYEFKKIDLTDLGYNYLIQFIAE